MWPLPLDPRLYCWGISIYGCPKRIAKSGAIIPVTHPSFRSCTYLSVAHTLLPSAKTRPSIRNLNPGKCRSQGPKSASAAGRRRHLFWVSGYLDRTSRSNNGPTHIKIAKKAGALHRFGVQVGEILFRV